MNLGILRALIDALIDENYGYSEITPCNGNGQYLVGFEVYGDDEVILKFGGDC